MSDDLIQTELLNLGEEARLEVADVNEAINNKPTEENSEYNRDRILRAEAALLVSTDWPKNKDQMQLFLGDMMANIMHLCNEHGLYLQEAIQKGRRHYRAEKNAESEGEAFENYTS